jgi:hypothetical protein
MATEPGIKLDQGKEDCETVLGAFSNALIGVSAVGTFGIKKYSKNGWLEVDDAPQRYLSAAYRHKLKRQSGELYDDESGILHILHEAWNLLAVAELTLRAEEVTPETLCINQESANSIFKYDPYTGQLTRHDGSPAGHLTANGYLAVSYYNKHVYVHRLIWLMVTGEYPKADIDHINRIRTDNRWVNLRDVTRSENLLNKTKKRYPLF